MSAEKKATSKGRMPKVEAHAFLKEYQTNAKFAATPAKEEIEGGEAEFAGTGRKNYARALKYAKQKKMFVPSVPVGDGFTSSQVKAMLIAAPPKRSLIKSDGDAEKTWMRNLPKVTEHELEAGDILILKDYSAKIVPFALKGFSGNGSKYSVHAVLVMASNVTSRAADNEDRKPETLIAESVTNVAWDKNSPTPTSGVATRKLDPSSAKYIVYRPTSQEDAANAVKVAEWLAGQKEPNQIGYSYKHCVTSLGEGTFTKKAGERVRPLWEAMSKDATYRHKNTPKAVLKIEDMMCSELVTLCYQGTEEPYIDLNAKKTLPPRLESWLIKNPDKFTFLGTAGANMDLVSAKDNFDYLSKKKKLKAEPVLACLDGLTEMTNYLTAAFMEYVAVESRDANTAAVIALKGTIVRLSERELARIEKEIVSKIEAAIAEDAKQNAQNAAIEKERAAEMATQKMKKRLKAATTNFGKLSIDQQNEAESVLACLGKLKTGPELADEFIQYVSTMVKSDNKAVKAMNETFGPAILMMKKQNKKAAKQAAADVIAEEEGIGQLKEKPRSRKKSNTGEHPPEDEKEEEKPRRRKVADADEHPPEEAVEKIAVKKKSDKKKKEQTGTRSRR